MTHKDKYIMLTEHILTHYPLIMRLRKIGFSYTEIVEYIAKEFNVNITSKDKAKYLISLVNRISKGKFNESYSKLVLLSNIDKKQDDCTVRVGEHLFLSFNIIIKNSPHQITTDNIFSLKSFKDAAIAKRILLMHGLSDEELFDKVSSYWMSKHQEFKNPTEEDFKYINEIHLHINDIIVTAITELKTKLINYKGTIYEN